MTDVIALAGILQKLQKRIRILEEKVKILEQKESKQ
jgi:hypothetical protein